MKKKFPSLYQDHSNQTKHNTKTHFYAIKKLHDTQIQLQALRNRLRVLQSNEHKNNNKINIHQQRIDKLQAIRDQHLKQIRKMNVTKNEQQKLLEELKEKNQIKRKLMKNRIDQILDDIAQQKVREYLQICEQRQVIESKISENRQKDLSNKQFRRNKIIQRQQISKQKYHQFMQNKADNIIKSNVQEASKINRKRAQKEHQLQQMTTLQAQLLRKHSQSQMAFNSMKDKLNNMLGTVKINHNSKQKQNNLLKRSKVSQSQHQQQQREVVRSDSGVVNVKITSSLVR